MDSERWQRIETLFDAALDLAPSRWDTFLDEHCRGDLALRAEVASLLASHIPPGEPARATTRKRNLPALLWRYRIAAVVASLAIAIVALALTLLTVTRQRDAAIQRGLDAEQAARAADARGYVNAIAAAEASIRTHEIADAHLRLEQTPEPLRGWEWRHLWGRLDRSLYARKAHASDVTQIVFAGNGASFLTASRDGTVCVWTTADGDSILRLGPLGAAVESVALRANDAAVAVGLADGTVLVLDSATGAEHARLAGKGRAMVAFNPGGTRLAAAFGDGTVREWRTDTFKPTGTLEAGGAPLCVAYSPDGRYLITGDDAGRAKLWDTRSNRRAADLKAHDRRITAVVAGDGGVFATASLDHSVKVWRVSDRRALAAFHAHESAVTALAFLPGGGEIVSAGADGRILRWNAATGAPVADTRAEQALYAVAVDPVSGVIAAGGADGAVRVWPASLEDVRAFRAPPDDALLSAVNHARVSHDGKLLAGAANRLAIDLWDAATGAHLARLETGRADYPTRVAFSPAGSHLFAGDRGGNVVVFEPRTQRRLLAFAAHSAPVTGLDVTPDGSILVSAAADSTLKFWDAKNLAPRGESRGLNGAVTGVVFAPDGTLATACSDRVIRLWNAATGDTLRVLRGHTAAVVSLAYSPDGARIASVTRAGELRIWSAAEARTASVTEIGRADAVCFSPDGTRVLAAGPGSTVRVIDVAENREVARLHGHAGRILSLETSPRRDAVVSASADGTIRLWDAE